MKFGSVCSGIEAASVAWHPLGWSAAWFSEIEPFPCAVLAHHYPEVPNLGDMTDIPALLQLGEVEAPDLLCGGTPCQAFSVAGLRRSLDDARGNLSLTFCEIANAIDQQRAAAGAEPCIVFWENVPGVLNTKDNAFGCFLAGLAGEDDALEPPGGRWANAGVVLGPERAVAWRTLDAQFFGLAQRRRRVFVVASARDGFDPVAVLLESGGLRRDSAPRREAGEGVAPTTLGGARKRGGYSYDDIPLAGGPGVDLRNGAITGGVAHTLQAGQHAPDPGGTPHVLAFDTTQITSATNRCRPEPGDPCHPLAAGAHAPAIAFNWNAQAAQLPSADRDTSINDGLTCSQQGAVAIGADCFNGALTGDVAATMGTRSSTNASGPTVMQAMQVRRLTPRECERLQGFPDDYTLIPVTKRQPVAGQPAVVKMAADGPRYKALGNSWAVPVVRWIGWRMDCIAKGLA